MYILSEEKVNSIIELALGEDAGRGDITSQALIPRTLEGKVFMLIKEPGVLAGIDVARKTFLKIEPSLKIKILMPDGSRVKQGDKVLSISGRLLGILKAERVALNFVQRLSGIASTTARYVEKVQDLGVEIADTRKTTPGLRLLEKYAVRMGGGRNHRYDLADAVLIKDNHIDALRSMGMSFQQIIMKAKEKVSSEVKIEVEARTVDEASEAAEVGVDIIMLDNMGLADMAAAVKKIAGRCEIEASGGINLQNVRQVAETGVDFISIGALTHSFKSLDISLELESQALRLT